MSDLDKLSRREFVATGIGYAAATLPITVWAVTTPKTGLIEGDIEIPTGTEKMPGYWAMPTGKGPFPVILVIQEIFGIHEYIKDVARRLAKEGYLAIAPSLYFRQGDATKVSDTQKLIADIVSKVKQAQVMTDLDATVAWLAKNSKADVKRLGITGFCWGGNVTWMYCAHSAQVKAGVAWYGRLVGDKTENQPRFPLEVAAELKAPVLGLYGEKDKGIPLETVDKMKAALQEAKSPSHLVVYPGAEHGFHADYRPSYHAESAKQAWEKMLGWFRQFGVR